MAAAGIPYMTSKEGILRVFIISFACVAFALIADFGYADVITWVMVAYILAFCLSLLSYFFICTTLSTKMNCGITYDTVDVCLSVFSFFHCSIASIVFTLYVCSRCDELIAACVFGFLLAILYAIEMYFLKENAPGNLGYLTTPEGVIKTLICILGCTTFALLDIGGYANCGGDESCEAGRTFSFAAYIYCWVGSTILMLLRIFGVGSKIGPFGKIDMFWSVFSFLNYIAASIVLACYFQCKNFDRKPCSLRLAADIFGFVVAILYLIDAVMKQKKGVCVSSQS